MGGSRHLLEEVIGAGFCTGCGACVTGCPYVVVREGRIVVLDRCTIEEGDCYRHCPRTRTDLNALSETMQGVPFGGGNGAVGPALAIAMARSIGAGVCERGQDGGTVTALLALALDAGMIDAVICTKMDERKIPHGFLARSRDDLLQCAGSSYEAAFTLEAFRKIPTGNADRLAVVGVGCQTEALAKMRAAPPVNGGNPDNIQFTIGLFCGWVLRSPLLRPVLERICDSAEIVKFEIPHSPHTSFDVYTDKGKVSLPLDDIRHAVNPACRYCWDMTAEFSDISVGSAGSRFPGWNTVIIRTKRGAELFEKARSAGIVESQPLPDWREARLQDAALSRKKSAFQRLSEKSGDRADLFWLAGLPDGYAEGMLKE